MTAQAALTEAARAFARDVYGFDASARRLPGERDVNIRLDGAGEVRVLKLSHPDEDPEALAAQTEVLAHLAEAAPDIPVQRVLPTRDGAATATFRWGGAARTARLMSWLPGMMLAHAEPDADLRRAAGRVLGALDRALAPLPPPRAPSNPVWDMTRAQALRPCADAIADPAARRRAHEALDGFESHAAPFLARARAQVIHNDLNLHNLLIDPAEGLVTGVLDFGDMALAPAVFDLAVAAAYHVGSGDDPLAGACDVAAGRHAALPLEDAEIAILFDLIRTRLAMTIAITERSAAADPDNRAYLTRNAGAAAAGLESLSAMSRDQAAERIARALR